VKRRFVAVVAAGDRYIVASCGAGYDHDEWPCANKHMAISVALAIARGGAMAGHRVITDDTVADKGADEGLVVVPARAASPLEKVILGRLVARAEGRPLR